MHTLDPHHESTLCAPVLATIRILLVSFHNSFLPHGGTVASYQTDFHIVGDHVVNTFACQKNTIKMPVTNAH